MIPTSGGVAVITGGASGIGAGLAEAFLGRGLRVVVGDVEERAIAPAVERLGGADRGVIGVRCDVSRPEDLDQLRDRALDEFGRVDVVCPNAGIALPFRPLWETSAEDWSWILDVNLRGVINTVRAFVPGLVEQGSGHVLSTASLAGVAAIPGNGPYNVTKHGVVSLTETLAADLAAAGSAVGATVLCVGLVATNIAASARNKPGGGSTEGPRGGRPAPRPAEYILNPEEVAGIALKAIDDGVLYAFTDPRDGAMARARIERLLADVPDVPRS